MVKVRRIAPEVAARDMARLASLDPRGLCTEADMLPMCQASECLEILSDKGRAVVVLTRGTRVTWIDAAVGEGGSDLTKAIDDAMRQTGAGAVAFQTKRRGLVARAEKLGYQVVGYIMRRDE